MTKYESYPKVPLDSLTVEFLFDIPDLDEDAAVYYLRRSAIIMAQKGNLLRRMVDICPQPCIENYTLESPDCMDFVAVMSVCQIQGSCCGKVVRLTNEPCRMPCGAYSWFREPNEICFSEVRCNQQYRVEFSVAPQADACEIDSVFQTRYWETLLTGARALAYDLNDKPWSNANRATHYRTLFENSIRDLAVDVNLGGQRGAMKIKRPWVV